MIFRTLVVLQAAYVALATETNGWSYLEWENHDGVQVSSEFDFEIQWDYEIIQQLRGWLCISYHAYANGWPFKMHQPKDIFPGQLFALTSHKIYPNLIFLPGWLKIYFLPSTSWYDTWSKNFWWSRRRLYQQGCYFSISWGRCRKCSYHLLFNRAFWRWSGCSCQWLRCMAWYYQAWWGTKLYLSWYRRNCKLYSFPSKVFIHFNPQSYAQFEANTLLDGLKIENPLERIFPIGRRMGYLCLNNLWFSI